MRADRLVAELLLLQARGRVTAAELARELEVSVTTARRDLESLSTAGFPVYAQPGRGGGWQLLGGGRTDLSGLSAAEAEALFVVAGPHAGLVPAAKSALRKLARALPEPFREEAAAAAGAVVVDATDWGVGSSPVPAHRDVLRRAVIAGVQVHLRYRSGTGTETTRTVSPLGLATKAGTWYLLAATPTGRRLFRLDRVVDAAPTEVPAERPPAFDLAGAWQETAAAVEALRTRVTAVVLAPREAVEGLRLQFGADADVSDRWSGDRRQVRVSGTSTAALAERLAGWGDGVEVVHPPELRRELAETGRRLVAAYGAA